MLGSNVNLRQILGNVFINAAEAIEATGRGSGHINIEIAETTHAGRPALDIAISDDGEGIDPAALTRIFEKGFSTRQKTARGLGLHWCANTMNGMGGRIYAESNGVGHGATVHLVLPLADAGNSGRSLMSATTVEPPRYRLLVADDEPNLHEAYRRVFQEFLADGCDEVPSQPRRAFRRAVPAIRRRRPQRLHAIRA